jgi:hypothetical protein
VRARRDRSDSDGSADAPRRHAGSRRRAASAPAGASAHLGARLNWVPCPGGAGCSAIGTYKDSSGNQPRLPLTSTPAISSLTLSPQAVTLPNPANQGGKGIRTRIAVSLQALDSQGNAITQGKFQEPIKLTVYGPPGEVLKAETPVIDSPTGTVYFDYNGGFVANPIIVTAVSGEGFGLMSFQPQHRGFAGSSSVTFPIPNTNNENNIANGWHFTASLGGGRARRIEMDTGSRGVAVPVSALGPQAVGPGPPGEIFYDSDGQIFTGHFYLAPITFSAAGAKMTTVPIEVLAVDASSCAPGYPDCTPGAVSELSMMGVGFDRSGFEGSAEHMPPELDNPFLALTNVIQGSMHPGYVITSDSATLGITAADDAGFSQIRLTPGGTGSGDWNTEPGCFTFPTIAGYPPRCGTVLVDTGIPSAILGLPRSQRPPSIANTIPDGAQIGVALPTTSSPVFSYSFAVGDGGPMTPTSIRWAAEKTPFMNTGRRPISGYDYLFDDGSGYVGFKPASIKPR